jgi:hypothetical protein
MDEKVKKAKVEPERDQMYLVRPVTGASFVL